MESGIRRPAVAGSFYPSDKGALKSALDDYFADTKKTIPDGKTVKGLIVPHAGYVYSGRTAAWGFAQLPKDLTPPHFVLIGPSHRFGFAGLVGSSAGIWQTPLGEIKQLPPTLVKDIVYINDPAHIHEHSVEVQLPFLQMLYPEFSVTCLLTGMLSDPQATSQELLAKYAHSVFIISSDLSHYLSQSDAEKKDKETIEAILQSNSQYFLEGENTACGYESILLLLEMAKVKKWQPELLCYDTSATASADADAVVGYAAIAFTQ